MPDEWIEPALALFRAACELPEGERAAFLDEAVGQNAELRRHVEAMLARDGAEPAAMESAAGPQRIRQALSDLVQRAESDTGEASVPENIGGYRVVRRIGHGGMGIVYEAEQDHPQRRVAIKVARTGGATTELARRFALEAQLLARLDHEGIAKIIEAGTTSPEAGAQPFFVMEFVEGQSLTDYAAARRLGARQTLELMVEVCAAVGFAHERGVVHRDLKPDNVMIDATGKPKVFDFGVAKVEAAGGFGATTLRAEAGRVLGTLGYMAPEQFAGKSEGLGPEADVYSLGVMIYELLTGRLPHELSSATITEALAVVTSTDAPLLGVVRAEYRGDIQAVVAKALQKDHRHRFPDAGALRADLERYLAGEPTLARPAGPLLKFTKWTRRNPSLATAVFGLFLALSAASAILLVKNREVRTALDEFELLADSVRLQRAKTSADELVPVRGDKADGIARWLETYRGLADPLRHGLYVSALERIRGRADAHEGESWTFDHPLLQLKHDVLAKLVADLGEFQREETGLFQSMRSRLELAETIEDATVRSREKDWDAAIERIGANEKNHGLTLKPQVGLVPLGQDEDSELEEFLHFETHVGEVPRRDDDGHLPPMTGDTGLVFVLIPVVPGEKVWIGAQKEDPNADYFDRQAIRYERLRQMPPLAPFFLSKYEMTQGQWLRATGQLRRAPESQETVP